MPVNGNQFKPQDTPDNQNSQDNFMSKPVNISGSDAQSPSNGAAPNSAQNQPNADQKPTSSGRFQNLNAYLDANKNFNQNQGGLAGQINQNLTSKSNDLQKNFAQAKQDYETTLNNARQRYDQNFVNNTIQNPTQVSDADAQKFAQQRDAQYQGPTQLDPEYKLQGQAQNFSDMANQTGNESGRFNLLRQLYDSPNYTAGQQSLDNLFLQAQPDQLANLQNSRITSNQLNSNLGNSLTAAQQEAQDASTEANATRQQTRDALTGAVTGFDTNLDNNVQQALKDRQSKFDQEQSDLHNAKLNSQDALNFGLLNNLGDTESNPIYNLHLDDYLDKATVDPTRQTVASADDYNRIAALAKLSGNALDPTTTQIFDKYGDPNQAGSFQKLDPYSFNTSKYTNALNAVKGEYEPQRDQYQGGYDQAYAALNGGGMGPGEGYAGGLLGEETRQAVPLRQQAQDAYNQQLELQKSIPGMQISAPNPQGMSDFDVIKNFGINSADKDQLGNYIPLAGGNDRNILLQGITANQQKLNNTQSALKQLADRYGANRTVHITDADKYRQTQVAPNPITGLPGSGDVQGTTNQAAALDNIYNRI